MKIIHRKLFIAFIAALIFVLPVTPASVLCQDDSAPDLIDPWPKTATDGGVSYTMYQPQIDSWDGYRISSHAAVSVVPTAHGTPVFGALYFSARTLVDKTARTVYFNTISADSAVFPTAPLSADKYRDAFLSILDNGTATMPLDRLQASLAIVKAESQVKSQPLNNPDITVIFSQVPAILINVAGSPRWIQIPGTGLKRILNTRAYMVSDETGKMYLHIFDGFLVSDTLNGPWQVSGNTARTIVDTGKNLAKNNIVDLLPGQRNPQSNKMPTLSNGAPAVYIATAPTELIITDGVPVWEPVSGTSLSYVTNTTGNIFQDSRSKIFYLLVTGRWFRSQDLDRAWAYIPAKDLPEDFSNIPDTSPKENVKASIPGTVQAAESLIENSIPQTTVISRKDTKFNPRLVEEPKLLPVEGTSLSYVINSLIPIIMVSPDSFYACANGVWFTTNALKGRWTVAADVPPEIYTIPPRSPLHYVTYVKIYDSTKESVTEGYTPGYLGTAVNSEKTVVFGTGYDYSGDNDDATWVPYPPTFGYAANFAWTPWTGWAMGYGMGWNCFDSFDDMGWGWGDAPYWGGLPLWGNPNFNPANLYIDWSGVLDRDPNDYQITWGPDAWAAGKSNIYQSGRNTDTAPASGYNAWNGTTWPHGAGRSYNSITGQIAPGQDTPVKNVYERGQVTAKPDLITGAHTVQVDAGAQNNTAQSTGASHEPKINYYADKSGTIYQDKESSVKQLNRNGSWSNVSEAAVIKNIKNESWARSTGTIRSNSSAKNYWDKGSTGASSGAVRSTGPLGSFGGFSGSGNSNK
ncbi:MAG: hypothetical protein RDV48_31075 [Candidatus Eremiobacteraeota bacterium]|nr:hypothetical protein [Candidatus Eremiobacteraeota bacterium]